VSTPSPAVSVPRPAHLSLLGLGAALVGAVLLVVTIRQVGWSAVVDGVRSVGLWFIAVVALGGMRFAARARSWLACTEEALAEEAARTARDGDAPNRETPVEQFDFRHAFGAVLAADALGNLTPLGLLASEPAKVLLVRRRLSTVAGISSVAADNVFYTLSVLVMFIAGALVFVRRATVPAPLTLAADIVAVAAAASVLVAIWIGRQRPAVLSWLAGHALRLTGRGGSFDARLREIELRFYGLVQWPAERLLRIAGWQTLFHIAAVTEVFLVLRCLPGSAHATLLDAFVLEAAGRLVTVLFKFVPYRLGVDEAGAALVARTLAFDPTVGVALALVRRLRIIAWNIVGVAVLARRRA
jgi:glycosyltransferase 2 family protein